MSEGVKKPVVDKLTSEEIVENARQQAKDAKAQRDKMAPVDLNVDEAKGMVTSKLKKSVITINERASDPEGINKFLPKSEFIKRRQAEKEKKAKLRSEIAKMDTQEAEAESDAVVKAKAQVAKVNSIKNRQKEVRGKS